MWQWVTPVAVLLIVFFALAVLFEMNRLLRHKINVLATARSDNVQWSLAQSDVDILALKVAISDTIADPLAPVSKVRTRFDIFYSRAQMLAVSPIFEEARKKPEIKEVLRSVGDYLDKAVLLIDNDDAALRDGLPQLAVMTSAIRTDVRSFSTNGVSVLAKMADMQRAQISDTLSLAALLVLACFLLLMLMLGLLVFLIGRAQKRAMDQSQIRARLAAIVSTSLDAIVVLNKRGTIIDFNGAAEQIFGYVCAEAIGQKMEDLIVPNHLKDLHRKGMERYQMTGEEQVIGKGRIQLEARRKSGEIFPVEISIAAAESAEGEIFVSFLRDISKTIASEQELVEARDKAIAGEKAKANLIAVMSHEMRTPLNGMLGTLQLIEPANLSRKDREYIEIIGVSGKLLLHHVDNVLEISRSHADRIQVSNSVFPLQALVGDLVKSQRAPAEHRGNKLTRTVDMNDPDYAVGDPTLIRQIILNLIGNAIKFTRNGSISVEAKRIQKTDIVEFRVTDTGIGIAQKDRMRIFDEFVTLDASYSREVGGTGLGLAIVKSLAEAMSGEVGLDSSDGEGSSFWVRLPIALQTEEKVIQQPNHAEEKVNVQYDITTPMNVLIIEDNRINRIVLRDFLEKDGHRVDEATNGKQGVQSALAKTYDLILMDISMPMMDGLQATKEIRKAEPEGSTVPIVAVTAHVMPSEIERFSAAGMNEILTKPVSLEQLRGILRTVSDCTRRRTGHFSHSESSTSQPIVDNTHLKDLADALGPEQTKALIARFLSEMENDISIIVEKIETKQFQAALRAELHHAAGSAALLGAEALRAALCNIEDQLYEGQANDEISSNNLKSAWSKTAPKYRLQMQT